MGSLVRQTGVRQVCLGGGVALNGLANQRDFEAPVAAFEDKDAPCQLIAKFQGNLWSAEMKSSRAFG